MGNAKFRPDIEGLRAISIIAVVLYHARIPGFSGGFVGVDVFFVISGFLISRLLLNEIESSQRIDLVAFWARRARRLLPNALLVLAITVAATVYIVPMAQQATTTRDVLAALFYVSNYRFAGRSVDYFDQGLSFSPVLHFWSLSVEEQFYFIWPLLLLALVWLFNGHSTARTVRALVVIIGVSFALSQLWMLHSQPHAFFNTEARIRQIALGGLLAIARGGISRFGATALAGVAWVGVLGIFASVVFFADNLSYPGYWAVLPAVSAAAVILGGAAAPLSPKVMLNAAPLQWIGRRSYSLYLWHWPLLVLIPLALPEFPRADLLALALVVPIAALAYAVVEDPIRRLPPQRVPSARALSYAAVGCGIVGLGAVATGGFGWAASPHQAEMAKRIEQARQDAPRAAGCPSPGWGDAAQKPCVFGAPGAPHVVVVFGDSHAEHLFDGVNEAARSLNRELRLRVKYSCPPIDAPIYDPKMHAVDTACAAWRESVIQQIIAQRPSLVLVASWTGVAGKMIDPTSGKRLERSTSRAIWRSGFSSVLRRLTDAGINVMVVRDTPRSEPKFGSACLQNAIEHDCATPRPQAVSAEMPDVDIARTVPGVGVLDITDRFCGPNVCPAVKDGIIVYRGDDNHLTASFSLTLAPDFQRVLLEAGRAAQLPAGGDR